MSSQQEKSTPEIDLNDVLANRVRAGEPIHVAGSMDESQAKLHAETINRLLRDTGVSVTVIYSPN